MKLKATLKRPFSEQERINFIVKYDCNKGYTIISTPEELQAWGESAVEELERVRKQKYDEANAGAKAFLESGNALYEFEPGKHIEAFEGNMSKMTGYLLAFESGMYQPTDTVIWVTKEDEIVNLTKEQVADVLMGIGKVQAVVWSLQFPAYVAAIESARTIAELELIKIEYNDDISILG